jgi:hypothetical protein
VKTKEDINAEHAEGAEKERREAERRSFFFLCGLCVLCVE